MRGLPDNFGPMRSEWIPDGDAGVAATIAKMKALMHSPQGLRSFLVRQKTLEAVRGVERGQHEIDSIFYWVKNNIEFRGEYGETLQSPEATLNLGAGDCDDQAVLAATMLSSLGYETRFKTIALRDSPDELSHVYIEVRDKRTGEWMPLDPTVGQIYPGWEPAQIARSETYGSMAPGGSNDALWALAIAAAAAAFF
jgi:transglutaminase-like putative cysteine protease